MKPNHKAWHIASLLLFVFVAAIAINESPWLPAPDSFAWPGAAELKQKKEDTTFETIKFTVVGLTKPVSEQELAEVERKLNCRFPATYRHFVQKYGPGYFSDLCVRVFSPESILFCTKGDQQRLQEFWFWPGSATVLSQKDGVRSVACFDTNIGHDIRFLPEEPSTMFVLSRDEDRITRCHNFADIVRLVSPDCDSRVYEFHPHSSP